MSDDYRKVAEGAHCEVWLHRDAEKVLKKAPAEDRARVGKIIGHLVDHGPADLHEKKFKSEGRYKAGHKMIEVLAVKSYQTRVLGGWHEGQPRRLMCPEATIKKTDKADQDQLRVSPYKSCLHASVLTDSHWP